MTRTPAFALAACAVLSMAACDALESESDRKAKGALSGIWAGVTEEADAAPGKTVTLHYWLALNADGKFAEKTRGFYPDGRILEGGADGEWRVTDDTIKLRYLAINGASASFRDLNSMYPLKIVAISADELSYKNLRDPGQKGYTVRRVAEIGKEPGK